MSDSGDARFTSEVRSFRQRTEPLTTAPSSAGTPFEKPRPRTTRFRLERVSLLPFVPAPLIAYVERARVRRRTRLLLLALVITGASLVVGLGWMLGRAAPSAVTENAPATSSASSVAGTSTAPAGDGASLAAAPLPVDSGSTEARESLPASTRPQARRNSHDDVHRSARPRRKGESSAWWW